ncbi:MAG: hypothetical protein RQ862_02835 [Candidatus Caldarchaeales archaeon]|nr:hypothetical protein [Candidatus Caldarchaeales archaeon]
MSAESFGRLRRRFRAKVGRMSAEELEGFDEWFMGAREGLLGFCGGVGEGLNRGGEAETHRLPLHVCPSPRYRVRREV